MRFINVSEGHDAATVAINLDQITHARYLGGLLDLYFAGGSDRRFTMQGPAATEVWKEIIKIH